MTRTEAIRSEDIISPAVIRKRLGMSQRQFAEAIHVPVSTLQNWEQGRTLMDPSARALMMILAREPKVALRVLQHRSGSLNRPEKDWTFFLASAIKSDSDAWG